jgi:hypothetical protein
MKNASKSDILKNLGSDIFFLTGDKVKGGSELAVEQFNPRWIPFDEENGSCRRPAPAASLITLTRVPFRFVLWGAPVGVIRSPRLISYVRKAKDMLLGTRPSARAGMVRKNAVFPRARERGRADFPRWGKSAW